MGTNNFTLGIDHPSTARMESFLRGIQYTLEQVEFDWHSWQLADRIIGGAKFHSTDQALPVIITLLFCDSYHDAAALGKANDMFPDSNRAKHGVNGHVLYFVESEDPDKVSELLGYFAGEE